MKSNTTAKFWQLYAALPREVRIVASKNYRLWQQDQGHPSLRFRPLKGTTGLYTVRVGAGHRAIGYVDGDEIPWHWIGTHAEYNKLVS